MQRIDQLRAERDDWRERAEARAAEIARLRQRIDELERGASRSPR